MEKQIRANVGFRGTPIRLLWRSKKKSEYDGSKEAVGAGSTWLLLVTNWNARRLTAKRRFEIVRFLAQSFLGMSPSVYYKLICYDDVNNLRLFLWIKPYSCVVYKESFSLYQICTSSEYSWLMWFLSCAYIERYANTWWNGIKMINRYMGWHIRS